MFCDTKIRNLKGEVIYKCISLLVVRLGSWGRSVGTTREDIISEKMTEEKYV